MSHPDVRSTSYGGGYGMTYSSGWNVTAPPTIVAGDIILVAITTSMYGSSSMSPKSGWTELLERDSYYLWEEYRLGVYYKTATGSEGGTTLIPCTQTNYSYITTKAYVGYAVSGADGVLLPEGVSRTDNQDNTPDYPTLVPGGGSRDYLWVALLSTKYANFKVD